MSSFDDSRESIPLPPPLPSPVKTDEKKKTNDAIINNFLPYEGFAWASPHLELQRACYFSHVAINERPKECRYKHFEGILQEGPTCGFVALSMLFNMQITAKDLFAQGVSNGFTINGEMFCANNLLLILRSNQKFLSPNAETFLYNGSLNSEKIKSELRNGSILLVPYDADVNHSPAMLKGHKAHWALIVGYLITQDDKFYVFARHGKSKYLALWSLESLSNSNSGLTEFAKPKKYENQEFLLPEGGIVVGLCEKSIVIRGVDNKEVVL
ncbi:actin maturation protease [Culicoides brevitarsis]|uniref:actin maturation protease n=1 Tax=Culicoides brevitarsis TaxID=469753 RepID=UPI00307C6D5D